MKIIYQSDFTGAYLGSRMVAEDIDIQNAIKHLSEVKKENITEREFLQKYTEIEADGTYFRFTDIEFPVLFSLASLLKYGIEHIVEMATDELERNKDSAIVQVKIFPK